jgi:hypothetical protein
MTRKARNLQIHAGSKKEAPVLGGEVYLLWLDAVPG